MESREGEHIWSIADPELADIIPTGYLYTEFASQADYEYVLEYAKKLDVVLWENASRRCFFGSLEGHANIRGFIERRSAGNV